MYCLKLNWLDFNVDMNTVEKWMRSNSGEFYVGNQAHYKTLELWFSEEPSVDMIESINNYWKSINISSIETTNYSSLSERGATKEAMAFSGKSKLLSLGLTEQEINALLGK